MKLKALLFAIAVLIPLTAGAQEGKDTRSARIPSEFISETFLEKLRAGSPCDGISLSVVWVNGREQTFTQFDSDGSDEGGFALTVTTLPTDERRFSPWFRRHWRQAKGKLGVMMVTHADEGASVTLLKGLLVTPPVPRCKKKNECSVEELTEFYRSLISSVRHYWVRDP